MNMKQAAVPITAISVLAIGGCYNLPTRVHDPGVRIELVTSEQGAIRTAGFWTDKDGLILRGDLPPDERNRRTDVERVDVSSELQAIVAEGNILQSNADNALVPYLSTAPNQWFVHNIRVGDFGDVRMSLTIQEVLEQLEDPRQEKWFRPTEASQVDSSFVFQGMPNGIGPATRGSYNFSEVSLPGALFRDVPDGVDAIFMLYSELQFALAEAAFKGWIDGDANAFYEAGIRSSFEYYEVEIPQTYFDRPSVMLTDEDGLEKIITQKWLASMLVGYEGWLNYRRTGFPELKVAVENLNNDQFPVRYIYPTTEQALNLENYETAVGRMGGDNYNVKGWWEKD